MENSKCEVCPRRCGAKRQIETGFCGANNNIKIAKVMIHNWEEPIISGGKGSGAIFFSNCSLKCVFCQNYQISSEGLGEYVSINELVNIIKDLESKGVNNINFVSPTHYTLQIIEALKIYKPSIPIVWNTSGYETVETIKMLSEYIDIFLTDIKYFSKELSYKYSCCKNYFEECSKAVVQMKKNQPKDVIENGIMQKGVIVRHLVLPGCIEDSKNILTFIANNLGVNTIVSLMGQYVPFYKAKEIKELNRTIKPLEYKIVENYMLKLGFTNGFVQELTSANECFTPNFKDND